MKPIIGQPAPEWSLDLAWPNAIQSPAELRGQWSVLLFFHIGCAGCTGRAIPFTRELAARYPNVNLVAIHTDFESNTTREQLKAVVDYFALPYPVLRDNGAATFRHYGAEGTPHWFLLDPNGVIQKSFFGSLGTALMRIDYTLGEAFQEG
ncbi:MAG: TlpA family protein disulfide reductase [Caldilineaceae bacterium]|nr:TlpA family protein disulfide reductase [Caldilineaceae bacterium]MCB0121645.1 TlpA family protein disulfide reductase [Caldilineaceae bacterium]